MENCQDLLVDLRNTMQIMREQTDLSCYVRQAIITSLANYHLAEELRKAAPNLLESFYTYLNTTPYRLPSFWLVTEKEKLTEKNYYLLLKEMGFRKGVRHHYNKTTSKIHISLPAPPYTSDIAISLNQEAIERAQNMWYTAQQDVSVYLPMMMNLLQTKHVDFYLESDQICMQLQSARLSSKSTVGRELVRLFLEAEMKKLGFSACQFDSTMGYALLQMPEEH